MSSDTTRGKPGTLSGPDPAGDPDPAEGPDRAAVREYYRRLAPHLEDSLRDRGDEALWRRVMARGHRRVLEVGAGTGRITRVLAEEAATVVALDVAHDLLRMAARRPERRARILPVVGDVRTTAFAARFDLVAAANDPFVHLPGDEDRDRAFRNVARHLAPGGRFVLDALWLPEDREAAAARPGGWTRARSVPSRAGGELRMEERWRCDPDSRRCGIRYRYRPARGPAVEACFRGRYWSPAELRDRLERAGLRLRETWGDFEGGAWDPERSRHLVVDAELSRAAPPPGSDGSDRRTGYGDYGDGG